MPATLTRAELNERIARLSPPDRVELDALLIDWEPGERRRYDWRAQAFPYQLPPPGDWQTWVIVGGRGAGKTRSGAEWVREQVETHGRRRVALVAATAADARDVMIEGESGILAVSPPWMKPVYEPSKRRLTWPNGAIATTYSAEEPESLRGPQHDCAWADDLAAWRMVAAADTRRSGAAREQKYTAWDMLQFGLRIGPDPRCIVTTTPRPTKEIRELLGVPTTVVTRGTTYDNRANLAPAFFTRIVTRYEGTRLGRQELLAELLGDNPGALWRRSIIENSRVTQHPALTRVVVAIDPSGSSAEGAAEAGIVCAGLGVDGQGYVLSDRTLRGTPREWASEAVSEYHARQADRIVAEVNYGGEMVRTTIQTVDNTASYKEVRATRGKQVRAEPIAALYEQSRVHHLGSFPQLEDELVEWVPGDRSPNRLDACFVAGTMIDTDRGLIPIEHVRIGMKARTREGFRRVLASGMTNCAARVITFITSDGRTLTGTGNHPVWTEERGWVPMDSLVWDDTLLVCEKKLSSSVGLHSFDTLIQRARQRVAILRHTSTGSGPRASGCFTPRFGSRITERYPKDTISTIRTATHSTTPSKIWSVLRRRSTAPAMLRSTPNPDAPIWIGSGILQLAGIVLPKAASGIGNTGAVAGSTAPNSRAFAPSVGASICPEQSVRSAVRGLALIAPPNAGAPIVRSGFARGAVKSSASSGASSNGRVRVHVLGLFDAGRAAVYNLEVERAPEYYANGVLVHNCVWALTELMLDPVDMTPWEFF